MRSYESAAAIRATPQAIWDIITNAQELPRWDSGVTGVDGRIAPGETIKVEVAANPGRSFPVKVTEFKPGERMVWSGGMPLGLFKGVRTYTLNPTGDGTTRFHMREEYTGPLTPMIWRSIPNLQPSFDQYAAGLKKRAEAGA